MTPTLRDVLAEALGLTATEVDALDLTVHVPAIGWSHAEPGLRLFIGRGSERLASVKRMAAPSAERRAHILACYERFAACTSFRPPRLLAWRSDERHLYLVESIVHGRPLSTRVAIGELDAETAAARLEAVLAELWELGEAPDSATLAAGRQWLLDAAAALLPAQSAYALVEAALATLEREHPAALRRVLSTHDVHAGNLLVDGDGQAALVDFDLAHVTAYFGLDVVRAWAHSAPLRMPRPPAFLDPAAFRLCEALYPVFEYAIQAPLLPPPERDALRRYAQDLFVRTALPEYHQAAVAVAAPAQQHPVHAQLFVAEGGRMFNESESLRFPFDARTGRATLATVIRTPQPLHAVRLDPVDLAQAVVTVHRFRLTPESTAAAPIEPLRAADAPGALELVGLLAVPGAAATYYAPGDDPQIIAHLDRRATAAPAGDGGYAYRVDIDLELARDWQLAPGFAPANLLGRLYGRLDALQTALDESAQRGRALAAAARAATRHAHQLVVTVPPAAAGGAPRLVWPDWRALVARARPLARALVARALHGRPAPAAGPAPAATDTLAVVPQLTTRAAWPGPLVSVVIGAGPAVVDADAVLDWAAEQTAGAIEVVTWDARSGTAWETARPGTPWRAADWTALCATLGGRYVALATPDLLRRPPTYLEMALLALAPEDLDFVVTATGDGSEAAAALIAGRAPGDADEPLPGTVARPEIVAADGTLDLDAALAARGGNAAVVGKILLHTTAQPDAAAIPFARALRGPAPHRAGPHLVVARDGATPLGALPLPVAPADTVLSLPPRPATQPTVLLVMPFLAVGGAEYIALNVVRGLRDRIRFVIVTVEPPDARLGTTADAFRAETPYVYTAPDALLSPLTFSLFTHLIRRFAPQTLYIANGAAWLYDALPTLRAHHPGLRIVDQVYDHRVGWIERHDAALNAAIDAHVASNQRIIEALMARGVPREQIHYILNGVDLDEYDPARYDAAARRALRQRFGLPAEGRVVAFVARMHPQKRPMDVVEVARQFAGDPSVTFLMAGDGALAPVVRDQVERLGLTNCVVRPFHRPSSECFAVADVLLLPSEYEGMPMVVLEALAMGVAVVATDVGNIREILERTGGGQVVDRIGDIGALRRAVRAVLDAPPDPAALRAAVAQTFTLPAMAEAYAQALLGGPSPQEGDPRVQ